MLTDERYKQLMEGVGLPNSRSLLQALKQCAMEAVLSERAVLKKLGEQEAVASKECGRWAGLDYLHEMPNGSRLYAQPLPAQAVQNNMKMADRVKHCRTGD